MTMIVIALALAIGTMAAADKINDDHGKSTASSHPNGKAGSRAMPA